MRQPDHEVICPTCGSGKHVVPVWEEAEAFSEGKAPDYIGCTTCRKMRKVNA